MRWIHCVTICALSLSAATVYADITSNPPVTKSDKDKDKDKGKDKDKDKDKGKGGDAGDADKDKAKDGGGKGDEKAESSTQKQRRQDHRKRDVDAVRAALGQGKVPADANALLRNHARVVARLEMVETIAENSGKTDLAARAAAALAKEDARFNTKLANLAATGSPSAKASASASGGGK
jgi:hypothetical protein